jgi:hypothetical protein
MSKLCFDSGEVVTDLGCRHNSISSHHKRGAARPLKTCDDLGSLVMRLVMSSHDLGWRN